MQFKKDLKKEENKGSNKDVAALPLCGVSHLTPIGVSSGYMAQQSLHPTRLMAKPNIPANRPLYENGIENGGALVMTRRQKIRKAIILISFFVIPHYYKLLLSLPHN